MFVLVILVNMLVCCGFLVFFVILLRMVLRLVLVFLICNWIRLWVVFLLKSIIKMIWWFMMVMWMLMFWFLWNWLVNFFFLMSLVMLLVVVMLFVISEFNEVVFRLEVEFEVVINWLFLLMIRIVCVCEFCWRWLVMVWICCIFFLYIMSEGLRLFKGNFLEIRFDFWVRFFVLGCIVWFYIFMGIVRVECGYMLLDFFW